MIGKIALISSVTIVFGIIQSILLTEIMPLGVVPDVAMILLIAASWKYGAYAGMISGFLLGIALDTMSLSIMGFHAIIYTLIAYLFGRFFQSISKGVFLMPAFSTLSATAFKYGGSYLIAVTFSLNSAAARFFTLPTLVEAAANFIIAPLFFFLFGLLTRLLESRWRYFR